MQYAVPCTSELYEFLGNLYCDSSTTSPGLLFLVCFSYEVLVSVLISVLISEGPGLGLGVDGQVSVLVSVSDLEGETPSLDSGNQVVCFFKFVMFV